MIEAARPKWLGDMIALAYRTGLRRGEMFGLHWDDIDFIKGSLCVNRSVASMEPRQRIVKEPKTPASVRCIRLDKATLQVLMKRKEKALPNSLWVFESKYGDPLSPWYTSKYLHDSCVKAGIEPRGIHILRHTHATLLLEKGVYPNIVQARLGHSAVSVTLGTYGHVLPWMQEVVIEILEAA